MKKILYVASLMLSFNLYAQIPQNGLIADIKFSGNTNNNVNLNSPGKLGTPILTTDRFENANKAYQFTAAYSDTIAYDIALENSDFTFAFWYKPDFTSQYCIIDWRNKILNSPDMIQFSSWQNKLEARLRGNLEYEDAETVKSISLPVTSKWTFCSFSLVKDTLSFYVDGIFQGKVKYTQGNWSVNKLLIGDNLYNSDKFSGKIDDIRIYNRGLALNEIQQLFNEPAFYTQSISGLNDLTKSYSLDTIVLNGVASSGLPITYTSSDINILKVLNNKLIVEKAGNATITANQIGNENFLPASSVTINISIQKPVIVAQNPIEFCKGGKVVLTAPKNLKSYNWLPNNEISDSIIVSESGVYSLITNGDTSNTIVVKVNPIPSVTFNQLPELINKSAGNIDLIASPSGGSFVGIGIVGDKLNPQLGNLGSRILNYTFTDANGCKNSVSQKVVIYDTLGSICTTYDTLKINKLLTGINNQPIVNTFKIYPNPVSDVLIIDNGNFAQITNYNVIISNSIGEIFFSSAINSQQFFVDVSQWATNSIYFVKVVDSKGVVVDVKKVILN